MYIDLLFLYDTYAVWRLLYYSELHNTYLSSVINCKLTWIYSLVGLIPLNFP